jgi:hypothetical protein
MREIELNQSQRVIAKKRQNKSLNREKQLTDRFPLFYSLSFVPFFFANQGQYLSSEEVIRPDNAYNKSTKVKKRRSQSKKKVLA